MLRNIGDESGQVLVIVALGIIGLLAVVGLAIDGGHVYQERRAMQNAADAAALAGARALCLELGQAAATAEADKYLTANGGHAALSDIVVDPGAYLVTVTSVTEATTFFVIVIGIESVTVSAVAEAQCGCSDAGCGLWPIAFDLDTFRQAEGSCPDAPNFLLWDDTNIECWPEGWDPAYPPPGYDPRDYYDCLGLSVVPGEARAWVDFSAALESGETDPCDQPGCGNAELKDRIQGYTGHDPDDPDSQCFSQIKELPYCIAGDSGVMAVSWELAGTQVGEVKRIPLYSSTGCTMDDDPGTECGTYRYRIEEFVCIKVVASHYILRQEGPPWHRVRVIEVEVVCPEDGDYAECTTSCGGPSGPPSQGCIRSVGLTR